MGGLELFAMALDTLPREGRVLLLAALLAGAFGGFAQVLSTEPGSSLNILFRKGALLALLLVPLFVYFLGLQVPVPVDELARFDTMIPTYVIQAFLTVWFVGACISLFRLWKDVRTTRLYLRRACQADTPPTLKMILARAEHWSNRLNLQQAFEIVCAGAEQSWHVAAPRVARHRKAVVVLPAAALNWPAGVVDALLLSQLAQLYQGNWRWLFLGRVVQSLYWPAPWVAVIARQLLHHLSVPSVRLARAAYRDAEGWRRDATHLNKRASTLQSVPEPASGSLLRLRNDGELWVPPSAKPAVVKVDDRTFEEKWSGSKRRKQDKERDPYEQAYWLIAFASMLAGVATTLTVVQRTPDFAPQYLNIKWQDQMVRRLYDDTPAESIAPPAPGESQEKGS